MLFIYNYEVTNYMHSVCYFDDYISHYGINFRDYYREIQFIEMQLIPGYNKI